MVGHVHVPWLCVLAASQGLGFQIGGTVLDNKRLRTLYATVGGFFATVIPLIISFAGADANAVVYGSFSDTQAVYAFRRMETTYEEYVSFCDSVWMTPASIRTEQEITALATTLAGGAMFYLGAERKSTTPGEDTTFKWVDGTEWAYPLPQEDTIMDIEKAGDEDLLYVSIDSNGVNWKGTNGKKGALCMAPSLAAIRGAIPAIINLGVALGGQGMNLTTGG